MSSTGPTLTCSFCRLQFLRADHLKRHEQTHFHPQSFPCLYCGKTFSRKDAAKRHESVHDEAARAQRALSCPSTLNRSCTACSRLRVRCSKTNPCASCVSRGISCTYMLRKRRRPHLDGSPGVGTGSDATASVVGPVGTINAGGIFDRLALAMEDNTYEFSAVADDPLNDPRGINWLPFDPSLPDGFGLPGLGSSVAALGSEPFPPDLGMAETSGTSCGPLLVSDATDTTSAYGYGSSIVASTETSHVELPSVAYESPPSTADHDDSRPRLPAKLYADGDGGRACTADQAILERRASLADGQPVLDGQPAWVHALQAKMCQSQGRHGHVTEPAIPDTILQEARTLLLPHLHESPASQSLLMVMDGFIFDLPALRLYVDTCMTTFLTTYPFFDTTLLHSPLYGWALCMATAAMGLRYLGISEIMEFSDHLCLVLHRLLMNQYEIHPTEEWLPFVQADALATICLCHSADTSMMSAGFDAASVLSNHCLRLRLLDEVDPMEVQSAQEAWRAWRGRESRRRTGLFLWLLDCSLAITTQVPPRFLAIPLHLRLPCDDRLWLAASEADVDVAVDWTDEDRTRLDVSTAVQTVQTKRTLPEPNTTLGTAVLIHSLVLRLWDPAWRVGAVLSQQKGGRAASPPPYPAVFPPYTKWRNGVCDALDVLHWDALGTSARSGGQEGPIFLQLHLARLVLLVPVRELLQHIGSFGSPASHAALPVHLYDAALTPEHCQGMLATWATKDRYKARLAVIHAAAVFWHVRRYSSDSFHQPLAVYLAASTLWAFGRFSAPTAAVPCPSQQPGGEQQYQRRMPKSILIDRPIDDELVQYFIRAGDHLVLMLEGVDSLCAADGPEQVLRDGAMLLAGLRPIWPVAENYRRSLEAVYESRGVDSH